MRGVLRFIAMLAALQNGASGCKICHHDPKLVKNHDHCAAAGSAAAHMYCLLCLCQRWRQPSQLQQPLSTSGRPLPISARPPAPALFGCASTPRLPSFLGRLWHVRFTGLLRRWRVDERLVDPAEGLQALGFVLVSTGDESNSNRHATALPEGLNVMQSCCDASTMRTCTRKMAAVSAVAPHKAAPCG